MCSSQKVGLIWLVDAAWMFSLKGKIYKPEIKSVSYMP